MSADSADALVDAIRGYIDPALDALHTRIDQLETQLKEQQTRGLDYCGTWQKAMRYRRGDAVTHEGSLWISLKADNDQPVESASAWQLAVKRGRDGRERP